MLLRKVFNFTCFHFLIVKINNLMEDLGFVIALVFCFRVSYRDGVMEDEPKPCAAVKGTQIMVCVNWTFDFICGLLV